MRIDATPYWPWPPVCFLYLPSASACCVIVSRKGTSTSSVATSTPNLRARRSAATARWVSPGAAQDGLVGLVDPLDHEGAVLLLQPVQPGHELVLVTLGLGADGDRQHDRLGRSRSGTTTGVPLGARVSPVAVSDSLGTATMSPAWASLDGLGLLAPQQLQDVEPLVGVGAGVGEHGVGADRPRQHPQQRDLADVGVGDRLEHLGQRLARRVAGHLGDRVAGADLDGWARVGGGGDLGQQGGEAVDADPGHRRAAHHREHEALGHAAGQGRLELGPRQHLAFEVALHEGVVADHDALDELLAHLVLDGGQVVGDRARTGACRSS